MHRDERRASTSKRSRETEAEAVAFVVCQAIGLETARQRKTTSSFTRVMPSCCRKAWSTSNTRLLAFSTLSARGNPRRHPSRTGATRGGRKALRKYSAK